MTNLYVYNSILSMQEMFCCYWTLCIFGFYMFCYRLQISKAYKAVMLVEKNRWDLIFVVFYYLSLSINYFALATDLFLFDLYLFCYRFQIMKAYKAVMLVEKNRWDWIFMVFHSLSLSTNYFANIINAQKLSDSIPEKHTASNCNTRGKTTVSIQFCW